MLEWNKCIIKSYAQTFPSSLMILGEEEEWQLNQQRLLTSDFSAAR